MPSVVKVAALVAMAALTLFTTTTQAQDIVEGYSKSGSEGGFQDNLNSLSTLSEGPYSSAFSLMAPVAPSSLQGLDMLDKRAFYCNPGYGICSGNYCCPQNQLCFPSFRGCCPRSLPYSCGNRYCCPYNSCLKNGQCGCNNNLYRCGNKCCKYGCNSRGDCACPSNYPVDCGDATCCPSGYTCVSGGKCQRYGSGGGGGGGGGSGGGGGGSGGGGSGSDPTTTTTRTVPTTTAPRPPPPAPTMPKPPSAVPSPPTMSTEPPGLGPYTTSIEVTPTIQPQSSAESLRYSSRVTILAVTMSMIALVLV